jgi:histidinol phosphatase-like PHP family hydrolase
MIDLHTHSLFSDGELLPSELVRRVEDLGYSAVAITDHGDASNLDFVIPRIVQVSQELNESQNVRVVPGVEITHAPPGLIEALVRRSRELGAKLVLIHGESIVEPVAPGTDRAGLEAGADIIAHPGLITIEEVEMAAKRDILLEISARGGHSLTNGHVARLAQEAGAKLLLNSDAHAPRDLMTRDFAGGVAEGAGLPRDALSAMLGNAERLLERIGCAP